MNYLRICALAPLFFYGTAGFAQSTPETAKYSHKIVVDSVLQTKAYTYMNVRERVGDRDSLVWLAMPVYEIHTGDTFYYDHGLVMGEFRSKELSRTFSQIIFISNLSTTETVTDSTVIPPMIKDTVRVNTPPPPLHTVIIKEVYPAGGYTYLKATEGDTTKWLAVVKVPAKPGQVYTYTDAALMKNFTSRELNRTFPEVYFIAKLTLKAENANAEKKTASARKPAPFLTITQLIDQKEKYNGKIVRIKGKVTRYSSGIMDKNWLHIDDGSSPSGLSDIAVTTQAESAVGQTLQLEGKISINKNFGSGYFFEVLMEDAIEIK